MPTSKKLQREINALPGVQRAVHAAADKLVAVARGQAAGHGSLPGRIHQEVYTKNYSRLVYYEKMKIYRGRVYQVAGFLEMGHLQGGMFARRANPNTARGREQLEALAVQPWVRGVHVLREAARRMV